MIFFGNGNDGNDAKDGRDEIDHQSLNDANLPFIK